MSKVLEYQKGESIRYRTIGRCIYCDKPGSKSGPGGCVLAREHIIPFALTGHALIFEAASCKQCENEIKTFEAFVLKKMLGDFRTHIGSPTRYPKARGNFQPVNFFVPGLDGARKVTRHMVRSTAPAVLACPRPLEDPGIEVGRLPEAPFRSEPWAWRNEGVISQTIDAFQRSTGYFGPAAMSVSEVNETFFLRFLAKIAHGYAMGEIGPEFRSFLKPLILGQETCFGFYIGRQAREPDRSKSTIFDIKIAQSSRTSPPTVCVNICLYPSLGTPAFSVIAGQAKG